MDSTYKIVVSRALNVNGPYFDKQGTLATAGGGSIGQCSVRSNVAVIVTDFRRFKVLSSHGNIVGPGHMAVHEEEDGVYM